MRGAIRPKGFNMAKEPTSASPSHLRVVSKKHSLRKSEKASDVSVQNVRCLWNPYLPLEACTLLCGVGGIGKSTFMETIAALGSRGKSAPDGQPFLDGDKPFDTAILCGEDPYDKVLVPRLVKAGADLSKIHLLPIDPWPDISTDEDALWLRQICEDVGAEPGVNLRMLFIDGWKDFILSKNAYDEGQIRPLMLNINIMIRSLGLSVVGNVHPPKHDPRGISGSAAFRNNSRSVLVALEQPTREDGHRVVVTHDKHNWTERGKSFAYTMGIEGTIEWLGYVDDSSILEEVHDADVVGRSDARELLDAWVAQGPVFAAEVYKMCEETENRLSPKTMRNARRDLGLLTMTKWHHGKKKTVWYRNGQEKQAVSMFE